MGSLVCGWVDFGMGYGGFMVVEVLWGFFFFFLSDGGGDGYGRQRRERDGEEE